MRPTRIDHLALYVTDPHRAAAALQARLPVRVLEETDEFVLVGRRPDLGKLTFFHADEPREAGLLSGVGMAVPCATSTSRVELGELDVDLVPGRRDGEVDLGHVALVVPDPTASARRWVELGFERFERVGQAERVRLGEAFVELRPGPRRETSRPLLGHVGLLVESFDEAHEGALERGLEVRRVVEAEHSRALFVTGPDDVEVELVEQLPSFALV